MVKVLVILLLVVFTQAFSIEKITVAVSANAKPALEEIVKAFKEKNKDFQIKIVSSSSGKLANQILKGAPFDVFLSADSKYPYIIYKRGLAVREPEVYAYGVLVLWTLKDINLNNWQEVLLSREVSKIAVANPRLAPYGKASIEALRYFKILKKVKKKLIYGESVSQVNQYIFKKLVDVGFTSKSSVIFAKKGKWVQVPQSAYSPIKQSAVLLSKREPAKKFYNYLFSKKAKEIFKKFGYKVDGK